MNEIWQQKMILSPSLICLDLCNLEEQVRVLKEKGVEVLHVDILDGIFSPSMPIGLDVVRQLKKKTDILFDVHLMVKEPEFYVSELIDMGVEQILFHVETADHVDGLLNRIHQEGIRTGVALKPATSLHVLDYILEKCDTVLLMMINPGYASARGEKQVSYGLRKIFELDQMICEAGTETRIELDGRVAPELIIKVAGTRANQFVVGSTCMNCDNPGESIQRLYRTLCGQKMPRGFWKQEASAGCIIS